jgi:hypothetical protein
MVGLPTDARHPGVTGTVAGNSHTGLLPPGQLSVFRAPLVDLGDQDTFIAKTTVASGALCPGDSGSGFVTVEQGRAIVRGVVSQATISSCTTGANLEVDFVDVFYHRAWILETMRVTDAFLDGNTRLRAIGRLARGVMAIGCPGGTRWGPLYVRGAQQGVNCENEEKQTVLCLLDVGQPSLRISKFTMRETLADGSVRVVALPFSVRMATYFGERPHGALREFECAVTRMEAADTTNDQLELN